MTHGAAPAACPQCSVLSAGVFFAFVVCVCQQVICASIALAQLARHFVLIVSVSEASPLQTTVMLSAPAHSFMQAALGAAPPVPPPDGTPRL